MPELFGTSYVLPAIIVVVLLLVLVLVLLVRRRRKATPPTPTKLEKVAAAPTTAPQTDTDVVVDTDPGADEVPAAVASPELDTAPALVTGDAGSNGDLAEQAAEPSPTAQSHAAPAARTASPALTPSPQRPPSNPILPVVLTMLEGWGDVSDEDLERLSVFRPEKLVDTLDTLQLPKDLERNDDVRYRLEQMSAYAARLQDEAEAADAATGETEEEAAPAAAQAAAGAGAFPTADGEWSGAADEVSGQDAGQDAGLGVAPAVAGAGLVGAAFYGATEAADSESEEPAEASRTWRSTTAEPEAQSAEEVPPAIPGLAVPPSSALPWTEEAEASEPAAGYEKPGLDTYAGATAGYDVGRATPGPSSAGVAAAAAGPGAMSGDDKDEVPTGDGPGQGSDLDDTIETVPKPKRALGDFVRTADDLLALPPDERAEMTTFLQPAELASVLRRTDDPELKKAVIDTLENIGKPSSLDVLRESMQDDDEEVRMRAQQAVDRIMRL